MCFSASASFSAGAVLAGLGTLSLRAARRPNERAFAAIPLLFALQQAIEGAIWTTFDPADARPHAALVLAYVLFAHVLWPVFVPTAALLLEPRGWRRDALAGLTATGATVGAWLLYVTFGHGVVARVEGHHIAYVTSSAHAALATTLYVAATGASLLLSSHRAVRLFGAGVLVGFAVAFAAYETWLISVWCFFAALLSALVLLQFRVRPTPHGDGAAATG